MTHPVHNNLFSGWIFRFVLFSLGMMFLGIPGAHASVCARVKIEIQQEATLERQGFEAHMKISNGLSGIHLENVSITVRFTDKDGVAVSATSDPDNTSARFFIRPAHLVGITDIKGKGAVAPESDADIYWLIVPAPGASDGVPSGTLYYVGATLKYTLGGEEETIEVIPDQIHVKPMPDLVLDYFLPEDVYGDDAFTAVIEPPAPFTLGVRVQNNGKGPARHFKIDSAQPKITENDQGLLIGFEIIGSKLHGAPVSPGLLVDFGDVEPQSARVASWQMQCTLSGKFVEFKAEFSHANELGGALTSLIDTVRTHFLVHEVVADLAGKDTVGDFLAKEASGYRLYESENVDTAVSDLSNEAALSGPVPVGQASQYTLTAPAPVAGFFYLKVPDPGNGQKVLKTVRRADGKLLRPENAWLSKTRTGSGPWQHFIHLFDSGGPGRYILSFVDAAAIAQPPVLAHIPERTVTEGHQLSFIIEASDPNGTTPRLSAENLPVGATFKDQGKGQGVFDWTPTMGQSGRYAITFSASDGVLTAAKTAIIKVLPANDTDADGIDDTWEKRYFDGLDRDGSDDFDRDGASDRQEFEAGTDPTHTNRPPTVPVIEAPAKGASLATSPPALRIANSRDPDGDPLTYTFELYADKTLMQRLERAAAQPAGKDGHTAFQLQVLSPNRCYVWRVRANDPLSRTLWAYGDFCVERDGPAEVFSRTLVAENPGEGAFSPQRTPAFGVTLGKGPDDGPLQYEFRVYKDPALTRLIAQGIRETPRFVPDTPLTDRCWYYWQARVRYANKVTGMWMPAAAFFVFETTPQQRRFTLTVTTARNQPLVGLPVRTLDAQGQDMNINGETNAQGVVDLDVIALSAGAYRFSADYLGTAFSSALFTLPETDKGRLVIGHKAVTVNVRTTAGPIVGARVCVYDRKGRPTGICADTDAQGNAIFRLPAGGAFFFRTAHAGNYFTSDYIMVGESPTTVYIPVIPVDPPVPHPEGKKALPGIYELLLLNSEEPISKRFGELAIATPM